MHTARQRIRRFLGWPLHRPVRTPTVLQSEELECGAAALGIVLSHHGRWVPVEGLRIACGVSRNGSKASNILRAARGWGLRARGYKVEPEDLQHLEPPLILHWNLNHFVVFEGFLRDGRARINDPRTGPRTVSAEELDEAMTGVVLVFEPGPRFTAGGEPQRLVPALRQRLAGSGAGLLFVFLVSLALVVPGLAIPAFSRIFIDEVLLQQRSEWLPPLLLAMVGIGLSLGLLTWLQRKALLRLETRISVEGSSRFLWHLLCLRVEFFQQRYIGDLSSRVALNDRIARLLSRDVATSALGALLIVVLAGVMLQYDPWLTLVAVAVMALDFAVLRTVSRRRVDAQRRLLKDRGRLTGTTLQGLEMIESLKANGSESDLFSRWAGYQAKVVNLRQSLERWSQPLEALPSLLAAVNAALILGVGGMRVLERQMTLGSLMAFQILAIAFLAPVQRLVSLGSRLQTAEGEMGQLDDILQSEPALQLPLEPEAKPVPEDASELRGQLELRGVRFGYSRLDPPLLEDIDLMLEPGVRIALVGQTGSGKSTVARLITGLYEPWEGQILFDGLPRHAIPRAVWAGSVAVVDQDIFVFEGTVRDNLTLWDATVSDRRLAEAARNACIYDEILARPGGFDSLVDEGGANWSRGQLQRLEIARALVGKPRLLVLDEATSALDPEIEMRVDRNLRRLRCSCLIIAHRLSTIRDADEILVLDQGRVVERGTHEELVRAGGPYLELIRHE
jgi:NHLM bacteriocin system ABC transporter peptidase/ATP-binding protein